MAPRSPSHAFDPTPALEHNRRNYSPLNDSQYMNSVEQHFPYVSKEVRFSSTPAHGLPRAHSIATDNVPLLPPVSSASALPRQAFRITSPTAGIDLNAYIENCRNLNEQLRSLHESERKTWEIERTALLSKIAELEFELSKSRNAGRRTSNEPSMQYQPHRVDRRTSPGSTNLNHPEKPVVSVPHQAAPPESLTSPVWKGPEQHPPTARVFPPEDTLSAQLTTTASEVDTFPELSKEISPTNPTIIESVPIPIQEIEPTLDGITLKSAGPALTSSFNTKLTSPQFGSPAISPVPRPPNEPPRMAIDTSLLLAPMDEKLKRDAGHTPMNFDGAAPSHDTSDQVTRLPSPSTEKPLAPAPTARPPLRPSEHSDSYFSTTDVGERARIRDTVILEEDEEQEAKPRFSPQDDKPLKGPLTLDPSARTHAADAFLSSVDAKLMAAVHEVSPTRRESIMSESAEPVQVPATFLQAVGAAPAPEKKSEPDDDMPKLRLKKSMNFGSAYGSTQPGRF